MPTGAIGARTRSRSGRLKRNLDHDGLGHVEIYHVDQEPGPEQQFHSNVSQRSITVRHVWGDLVDAYAHYVPAAGIGASTRRRP
ncbi:hypothetical protein OG462_42895 [Streptomyces sp. NBC_01077]|uniref:hypothetical protein n=1 Tax=Streptomyces sp. NBC_01077 TaxID=2903746 RepID=UPI0038654132|nr:hypothetical protein OG462_02115 [Streptomyces sp. NBC_01077]WSV43562.1 hypothetical protein OG462_42895 [Streptomyces sp. NBC_01077]